jgi:hypothetical protein
LIRFFVAVLAVALFAALTTFLAVRFDWIESAPSWYPQSLIILSAFTLVIYRYLDRLNKPGLFVQIYLLSMAVKLLGYGAYVALMILGDKPGANKNVLFFLVLYVIFTALEVAFLHRKIAGNRHR